MYTDKSLLAALWLFVFTLLWAFRGSVQILELLSPTVVFWWWTLEQHSLGIRSKCHLSDPIQWWVIHLPSNGVQSSSPRCLLWPTIPSYFPEPVSAKDGPIPHLSRSTGGVVSSGLQRFTQVLQTKRSVPYSNPGCRHLSPLFPIKTTK